MLEKIRRQSIRLRDAPDTTSSLWRQTGLARARRPLPHDTSTFLAGAALTTVALLVTRFARTAVARG
jgi:hypothetical protein